MSIVIPSYNDFPFLVECLESVRRTCESFDYEVIVVDDYCEPANRARLQQLATNRVKIVFRDERGGFAKAVNSGIALASHDVVLLNSDIVAQPGWLESLQRAAYTEAGVGLVSPMLVYPDGLIQYGGTYYARRLAPQWFGHLFVGRPANDALANRPWFIRSVSGACVYIRREALDVLVGLDEEYWLGFEDVDLGMRAWRAGYRCWYEPTAKLVHHESATRGYSQGKRELASMRYFWSLWSSVTLWRDLAQTPRVTFLISPQSSELWREYVNQLAAGLSEAGVDCTIRDVHAVLDEDAISELAGMRVVVACDEGATQTAWLATEREGVPVYLLPGIRADDDDLTQEERLDVNAGYRPEFEFVSPNRWAADRLAAHSAWESRAIVPPALRAHPRNEMRPTGVVTVGVGAQQRQVIEATARSVGEKIVANFDAGDLSFEELSAIRELRPRLVVSMHDDVHSLQPLALMSLGAVYIGPRNERTRYEVMDGYNCLLFARGDEPGMLQSMRDALTDDDVWSSVSANGQLTASSMHAAGVNRLARTITDICERAF